MFLFSDVRWMRRPGSEWGSPAEDRSVIMRVGEVDLLTIRYLALDMNRGTNEVNMKSKLDEVNNRADLMRKVRTNLWTTPVYTYYSCGNQRLEPYTTVARYERNELRSIIKKEGEYRSATHPDADEMIRETIRLAKVKVGTRFKKYSLHDVWTEMKTISDGRIAQAFEDMRVDLPKEAGEAFDEAVVSFAARYTKLRAPLGFMSRASVCKSESRSHGQPRQLRHC